MNQSINELREMITTMMKQQQAQHELIMNLITNQVPDEGLDKDRDQQLNDIKRLEYTIQSITDVIQRFEPMMFWVNKYDQISNQLQDLRSKLDSHTHDRSSPYPLIYDAYKV